MPKRRRPNQALLPDVRDGLTPLERAILLALAEARGVRGEHISSAELYGRVSELTSASPAEFQAALTRLSRRR